MSLLKCYLRKQKKAEFLAFLAQFETDTGRGPSVYEACYFLGLSPKKFMAQVRGLRDQGAEIKWFWLAGKNHENEIPVSKTELEQRAIAGGVARSFYQLQGSTRGKDGE